MVTQNSHIDPVIATLYDALMLQIEPELTSMMLPRLHEIYASETDDERMERAARYEKAFALFNDRFGVVVGRWKDELLMEKKQLAAAQIAASKREEESTIGDIDDAIRNA